MKRHRTGRNTDPYARSLRRGAPVLLLPEPRALGAPVSGTAALPPACARCPLPGVADGGHVIGASRASTSRLASTRPGCAVIRVPGYDSGTPSPVASVLDLPRLQPGALVPMPRLASFPMLVRPAQRAGQGDGLGVLGLEPATGRLRGSHSVLLLGGTPPRASSPSATATLSLFWQGACCLLSALAAAGVVWKRRAGGGPWASPGRAPRGARWRSVSGARVGRSTRRRNRHRAPTRPPAWRGRWRSPCGRGARSSRVSLVSVSTAFALRTRDPPRKHAGSGRSGSAGRSGAVVGRLLEPLTIPDRLRPVLGGGGGTPGLDFRPSRMPAGLRRPVGVQRRGKCTFRCLSPRFGLRVRLRTLLNERYA